MFKTIQELMDEEDLKPVPPIDPAETARIAAKSEREWKRGIELGHYDEEGNSLFPEEPEDEDEEDGDVETAEDPPPGAKA